MLSGLDDSAWRNSVSASSGRPLPISSSARCWRSGMFSGDSFTASRRLAIASSLAAMNAPPFRGRLIVVRVNAKSQIVVRSHRSRFDGFVLALVAVVDGEAEAIWGEVGEGFVDCVGVEDEEVAGLEIAGVPLGVQRELV